ncbi:MAG: DUF5676 family membrane protein [Patescibacteria group bacterium]|nr:DUF5676 family membrane protein [Patescibacteria group bacterium]
MLNGTKIAKVAVVWMTILYLICTFFAAVLPSIYSNFAGYLVHFGTITSKPEITFTSAIIGLVLIDIVTYLIVWLFVWLYNKMN